VAGHALQLRIEDRIANIPAEAWNALLTPDASPFVEHTWLACLEEAGCTGERAGWIPQHLTLWDGDTLVGAAPAYVKTNSEGEFVFDWSWADLARRMGIDYYPKLVVAVPFTPASGARVLAHPSLDRREVIHVLSRALRPVLSELGLSSGHVLFPEEDEARVWAAEGELALRHGVQYHWTNPGYADFEDFLKTLPSKKRTQLRRERKQPAMDGVTLRTLGPEEYTPKVADEMFDLYTTTVDKYFHGRRYLNRAFFRLVASRFAHRLAWVVAEKEGRVVASAFNVKSDRTLFGRYWGSHVDMPFLHFNVCFYHGIAECIQGGLQRFNPGAGGEHKRLRGFAPTLTYSAHAIVPPKMRAVVEEFLARERAAVSDYVARGGDDEER
jgi:predicted N-acyltransferase